MGKLDGKVAIITGAAQGMGAMHVRKFVEEGAKVAITDLNFEGAQKLSEGKGIGLRFLRHIERNSVLLYMVPIASEEGVKTAEEIVKEFKILQNELKQFNPELLDKKYLIAITKCDLIPEKEASAILKKMPKSLPIIHISSITNYHLTEIKDRLWQLLNEE